MSEAANIAEFQRPEEKKSLVERFSSKLGVDANKLLPALKQTAFQVKNGDITDSQMMALLIVANEYSLNPFTKEIFAYPDKGGIVPVVSVDGWSRIINENPQADGIEFAYSEEMVDFSGHKCHAWIECSIYRKDRSRPVTVREYFDEVKRDMNYSNPWKTHPKRMHRHKALIQAARLAFGFAGIYDQDEAERIVEAKETRPMTPKDGLTEPYTNTEKELFDQLLDAGDSIEMYVLNQTISEGKWISLYDSFEKGQKQKKKMQTNELVSEGCAMIQEISIALSDAVDANDSAAFMENISDLSTDALQLVLDKAGNEASSFYRELEKEQ